MLNGRNARKGEPSYLSSCAVGGMVGGGTWCVMGVLEEK